MTPSSHPSYQCHLSSGSPTPFKGIEKTRWEKANHQSKTEASCLVANFFRKDPLQGSGHSCHQHRGICCHLNCHAELPSWQMLLHRTQLSRGCIFPCPTEISWASTVAEVTPCSDNSIDFSISLQSWTKNNLPRYKSALVYFIHFRNRCAFAGQTGFYCLM